MKNRIFLLFLIVLLCLAIPCIALAHPGRTDEDGGHTDHSTGEYHWHHGMDDHQHYDIDGDGDLDCPYQSWTYSVSEESTDDVSPVYSEFQLNLGYNPSDDYVPPSPRPSTSPTSTPTATNTPIETPVHLSAEPVKFSDGGAVVGIALFATILILFFPYIFWQLQGGREGVIARNKARNTHHTPTQHLTHIPAAVVTPIPLAAPKEDTVVDGLKKQIDEKDALLASVREENVHLKNKLRASAEKCMHLSSVIENQKRAYRGRIDSMRSKHQHAMSLLLDSTEQYLGEDYLFLLAGAPAGHGLSAPQRLYDKKGLPYAKDGSEHAWGEPYTFYLATSSHPSKYTAPVVFHRRTCRYCNPNRPANIVVLQEARSTPCSFCKPSIPDLGWISKYEKLCESIATIKE